jgi:hypothetical protein
MKIFGGLILTICLLALPISCSKETSHRDWDSGKSYENIGLLGDRAMYVEVSCFGILSGILLIGLDLIADAVRLIHGESCPYCKGSLGCPTCKKPIFWKSGIAVTQERAKQIETEERKEEIAARQRHAEMMDTFRKKRKEDIEKLKAFLRGIFKKKASRHPPPLPPDSPWK